MGFFSWLTEEPYQSDQQSPAQPPTAVSDHGTDLLGELHVVVGDIATRAAHRKGVVQDRLAALEAEHTDLHTVEEKAGRILANK